MAIQGNYAFNGNFSGINIYDISNPVNPVLKTSIVCPASQNDVTVYKNLLFVGVETSGRAQLRAEQRGEPVAELPRHPHLRHHEHRGAA